jgi:hypothetical protein
MTQIAVVTKAIISSRNNTDRRRTNRKSIDQVAVRHMSCTVRFHTNHSHLLHGEQPYAHPCVFRLGK